MELVIMWVLYMNDMSTTVTKFPGTIEQCDYMAKKLDPKIQIAGCIEVELKPSWLEKR